MEITVVAPWYLVAALTALIVAVSASEISKLFVTLSVRKLIKDSKAKLEAQIKAMHSEL